MYAWSDLSKVKQTLWTKLHDVTHMVGQSANSLAQLLASGGHHIHKHINKGLTKLMQISGMPEPEKPVVLGQISSTTDQSQAVERVKKNRDQQVSTPKHLNTKGTLLLYFCIMSVLLVFCLGRCLVVPLSQASRFELNQRKHVKRLDKNGFIQ